MSFKQLKLYAKIRSWNETRHAIKEASAVNLINGTFPTRRTDFPSQREPIRTHSSWMLSCVSVKWLPPFFVSSSSICHTHRAPPTNQELTRPRTWAGPGPRDPGNERGWGIVLQGHYLNSGAKGRRTCWWRRKKGGRRREKPIGRSSGVVWKSVPPAICASTFFLLDQSWVTRPACRLITAVGSSPDAEGGAGFFRREQKEPEGRSFSEIRDRWSCRSTLFPFSTSCDFFQSELYFTRKENLW